MAVLTALAIALISFNSLGQSLIEDKKGRNLLEGNKEVLGQSTRFSNEPFTTDTIDANFSTVYVRNVSSERQCLFVYTYNETNETTAIRVSTFSKEAQDNFPITFVVREQEDILSWQVPVFAGFDYKFPRMNRTLCPMDETKRLNMTSQQHIYVTVATMSNTILSFNLTTTILPDFELVHGEDRELTASPSEPQYYMYTFPKDVDTVLLRVTSSDNLCAVISVQPIKCPVLDLDEDIGSLGKHQTMTTKAAFFLEKGDYTRIQAFYVIVLVKPKVTDCSETDVSPPQGRLNVTTKKLSIRITNTISSSQMHYAVSVVLATYIGVSIVVFITCCIGNKYAMSTNITRQTDCEDEIAFASSLSSYETIPGTSHDHADGGDEVVSASPLSSEQTMPGTSRDNADGGDEVASASPLSSVQTMPGTSRDHADCEEEVAFAFPQSSYQTTPGTSREQTDEAKVEGTYKRLSKSFCIYIWILGIVALFYGIPAAQMVFSNQKTLRQTGDEDMCYYNFDCAYPLKMLTLEFSAFNTIISNSGYIILGFLFIALVHLRSQRYNAQNHHRIPKQFGLLYAMGLALIVVGVMSACYHFCPTSYNYQFDTTFMYIIMCLCIMKIFEIHLPSTQPRAHIMFFCLAWITFLAVLGMVFKDYPGFLGFYAVLSVISTIAFGFQISSNLCSMGYRVCVCTDKILRQGCCGGRVRVCTVDYLQEVCCADCCVRACTVDNLKRGLCGLVCLLINVVGSIIFLVPFKMDFATFLLAILLLNFVLYFVIYTVTVKCNKTCKKIRASLIIVPFAGFTWLRAVCFFFRNQSSWESKNSMAGHLFMRMTLSTKVACAFVSPVLRNILMTFKSTSTPLTRQSSPPFDFTRMQYSPEASREKNAPCAWLDFYDNHDIWHFLSAVAIFLSLLMLLTLDDELIDSDVYLVCASVARNICRSFSDY